MDEVDCGGFELRWPCGIYVEYLQISCGGNYEFRDKNDYLAFVVTLKMEGKCAY